MSLLERTHSGWQLLCTYLKLINASLHKALRGLLQKLILGTSSFLLKQDEFSENFQTAFDPRPPSFLENDIADFFFRKALSKALYKGPKYAI